MRLLDPQTIETRVLPLVIAVGIGIVGTLEWLDAERRQTLRLADAAIQLADDAIAVCGDQHPYDAAQPLSAQLIAVRNTVSEAQP